ncbi:MAG: hypothetical protein ACXVB4_14185 [Pseudobdellovibrionaceae bacterium]
MKKTFKKALLWLSPAFVFFLSFFASAQEEVLAQAPAPSAEEERTWEQSFIQSNIAISKWFDDLADGLDLFLVGKRISNRPNQSNIKIENSTTSSEGQGVKNNIGVSINPRLPNLEEYWRLKFATYDEREESRDARNAYLRQTPRERNYGATIGVFRKLGNIRTAFQPRIELQNPLKISHSLSFESIANLKTYSINPKIEFYASADKGVGTFQSLNFYFQLTKIYSLTLVNQGDYGEKLHLYSVVNGISIGQFLTPKSTFSHNIFFSSNNHPNYHLESFNLSVAYNRVLYKRILEYQVIPNLDFQKTVDFKGVAGITLNIILNF